MNKREAALGLTALFVVACTIVYPEATISTSVPTQQEGTASSRDAGGASALAAEARGASPGSQGCPGPCNANIYECNPIAHRCVGNGSAALNLCKWDTSGAGFELPCGRSETVTLVNACGDPWNCGNCGVVCPSGNCVWGECR